MKKRIGKVGNTKGGKYDLRPKYKETCCRFNTVLEVVFSASKFVQRVKHNSGNR